MPSRLLLICWQCTVEVVHITLYQVLLLANNYKTSNWQIPVHWLIKPVVLGEKQCPLSCLFAGSLLVCCLLWYLFLSKSNDIMICCNTQHIILYTEHTFRLNLGTIITELCHIHVQYFVVSEHYNHNSLCLESTGTCINRKDNNEKHKGMRRFQSLPQQRAIDLWITD